MHHHGNRKQKSLGKEGRNTLLDLNSDLSWFSREKRKEEMGRKGKGTGIEEYSLK